MKLIWITEASYSEEYKISVTFNDGVSAIIDLEGQLDGEVFKPLRDKAFFREFELDSWTVTWPNGADFAPEFLYDLALQTRSSIVS